MQRINFVDNVTKANANTFNTLQDNIENAYERNIITAYLNTSYTTTSTSVEPLTLVQGTKIGNKLSIQNGSVLIGDGVGKIMVSAQCRWTTVTGTNLRYAIEARKNNASFAISGLRTSGTEESNCIAPVLISVSSGDLITLAVRTRDAAGGVVGGTSTQTFITIEVVG